MENEIFRKNLRFLREQRKISVRNLAEILYISKDKLWRIEQGKIKCSYELKHKISLYFEVGLGFLENLELEQKQNEGVYRMTITKKQYHHLCLKVMTGEIVDYHLILLQIMSLIEKVTGQYKFENDNLYYDPNKEILKRVSGSLITISENTSIKESLTTLISRYDEENEVVQEVINAINQAFCLNKETHQLWKKVFIQRYIFRKEIREIQNENKISHKEYCQGIENASILICKQLNLYVYEL